MPDTETIKTVLAAQLRVIEPSEGDLQEAKASLNMLQGLLPPGVNPEDEPDLLFIVANVAVAGLVNLNDDGIDIPTALSVYKKFEKKFVDVEHNRNKVRGYILHAGLSEFGTDRVITEDEARAANQPFNIATVAVLWKSVDPKLCAYLMDATNPTHPDYKQLSLSFEMGFSSCFVITLPMGEREIAKATKRVGPDDPDFDKYLAALRAKKGTGLAPGDPQQRVYRILPPDVIPLGEGIVAVPAAQVKGIDVIEALPAVTQTDEPTTPPESQADEVADTPETQAEDLADDSTRNALMMAAKGSFDVLCDKMLKNRVSPLNTEVTPSSTHRFMKYADLPNVKAQAAAATKIEDLQVAFANATHIVDALNAESAKIMAELEAQKNVVAQVEKAKQEAIASNAAIVTEAAETKKQLDEVKKQLDEIKAAQAEAAAEEQFQARMTALDEEFDLEKEERALLVDDVRAAPTVEAFAKFMDKQKVLMKDKSKKAKMAKKAADDKKAQDAKDSADDNDEDDMKAKAAKVDFKEIFASAVRTDSTLPNSVSPGQGTLKDFAAAAFADTEIGGRKLSEFAKKD